jgi:PHP domain
LRPVTRKQKTFLTVAVIIAVASGLLAFALPPRRLQLTTFPSPPSSTVVAGASHVHTTRSDGTGTPDEIAAAAARAGLQFVIFTDHGNATRTPDPPQYRHGVLCLDAVEISTADGHYVAAGMPAAPYPLAGEARDVVEDVERLGGFGIVAHPDSLKGTLQWGEWRAPVPALEWLNADTEWRDETYGHLARALLTYSIRPAESLALLLDRPDATLRRWDEMTRHRKVVAMAGSDAHARLGWGNEAGDPYRNRILLRLPSYENLFSTFSMRVELDHPFSADPAADSAGLLNALRGGRVYSVVDGFAGPAQFDFLVRSGDRQARQGESLEPDGPLVVDVQANGPSGSSIVLFRDGQPIAEGSGPRLRHELPGSRGVLRAEARLKTTGRQAAPWLVSNPVYVAQPAPQVDPLPPTTTTRKLDEPDAERRWHLEHQAGASGVLERIGIGPTIFKYALVPDILTQSVALVLPEGAALWEFDRVSFRGSASRPMRLSVQLRQPGGRDGQRWRRSVYLDTVARDITILFADMRPAGPTGGLKPDMAQIEDLLFVVDTTNTLPGTAGVVTLEALSLQR